MDGAERTLVPYKASELLKKCKSKEDIINIVREMGILFLLTIYVFSSRMRQILTPNTFCSGPPDKNEYVLLFNFL